MPKINEKGMWRNKEGDYVHPEMITPDKQLEDETVEKLIVEAVKLQNQMIDPELSILNIWK